MPTREELRQRLRLVIQCKSEHRAPMAIIVRSDSEYKQIKNERRDELKKLMEFTEEGEYVVANNRVSN